MLLGTVTQFAAKNDWTSEHVDTHSARYFMGRKYYVIQTRNNMSALLYPNHPESRMFWTNRSIFIGGPGKTHSYREISKLHRTGPTETERAYLAMVPNDNQEVPF